MKFFFNGFFLVSLLSTCTLQFTLAQCQYSQKEYDYVLERETKAVVPQLLFEYASSAEAGYTISCQASLKNVDGNKFLWMSIEIDNVNSTKALPGNIFRNKTVKLKLENQEEIALGIMNSKREDKNGATLYEISLVLGENRLKILEKNKILTIEIPWSKGDEAYKVASSGFFVDQIPCIK